MEWSHTFGDKVVLQDWIQGWASTRAKARREPGFGSKEELPLPWVAAL